MRGAPSGAGLERLRHLRELAEMKRTAELARFAAVSQSRARLIDSLRALGEAEAPLDGAPELMRARLAHAGWIEGRKRVINQRLAMVTADWMARRPAALAAFGRAEVLGKLVDRGERARAERRREGE